MTRAYAGGPTLSGIGGVLSIGPALQRRGPRYETSTEKSKLLTERQPGLNGSS